MPSFDVRHEPWIPVRYTRGASGPLAMGLADLFVRAHDVADFNVPVPPAAAALWRILSLITARITSLDAPDDWENYSAWKQARNELFSARRFSEKSISAYFTRHAGRFDLFGHARPWLQDPRLAAECPKSTGVNKLVAGRATGNNLVWLSHHTDMAPQPIPSADAVWHLLAWLYYGPSGKITARTVRGRTESNMTAGPLRSRISFHPLGRTLYESLIAGLVPPDRCVAGDDADLAPWEAGALPDPLALPPSPCGLTAALTGQFRHAILLSPSPDGSMVTDARITWAWRQPSPQVRDPYLIYDTSRDRVSVYARYAKLDRAVWRDLDALLLEDTGSGASKRPAVFITLADLPQEVARALRVRAIGFDQDGQTIDRQWFTATTPPVLAVNEEGEPRYGYGMKVSREAAEQVGRDLQQALRRAWAAIDPGDGPWEGRGMTWYWAWAEDLFWQMVRSQDFGFPNNRFIRVAVRAFERATSEHEARSPRVTRAVEKARGGIFASWDRTEPGPGEAEIA
jgi:CRISPR system Cascade subunit CasA